MEGFFCQFDNFEQVNVEKKGIRYKLKEIDFISDINSEFDEFLQGKTVIRITGKNGFSITNQELLEYYNSLIKNHLIKNINSIIIFDGDNFDDYSAFLLLIKLFIQNRFIVCCVKKYEGIEDNYYSKNFVEKWNEFNINLIIIKNHSPKNFGLLKQNICINIGSLVPNYIFNHQKVKETMPQPDKENLTLVNIINQNKFIHELNEQEYSIWYNSITALKQDKFRKHVNNTAYPNNLNDYLLNLYDINNPYDTNNQIKLNFDSGLVWSTGYLEFEDLILHKNTPKSVKTLFDMYGNILPIKNTLQETIQDLTNIQIFTVYLY